MSWTIGLGGGTMNKLSFKKIWLFAISIFLIFLVSCGGIYAAEDADSYSDEEIISDDILADDSNSEIICYEDNEDILNDDDIGNDPEISTDSTPYTNLFYDEDHYVLEGNSFDSIQYAIDSVEDNSIIVLNGMDSNGNPSSFYGNASPGIYSPITINKSITLDGNGNTLDARSLSRIFSVVSDNVTLKNLVLINAKNNDAWGYGLIPNDIPYDFGSVGGTGGVIKWFGDNGCLDGCIFNNNLYIALNPSGRVISWEGNNGSIIDSYFAKNQIGYLYPWYEEMYGSTLIEGYVHGDVFGDLFGDNVLIRNASVNIKPNLSIGDISISYGDSNIFYLNLSSYGKSFANENITISIFNKKYNSTLVSRSDSEGIVKFSLDNLPVGEYTLLVKYYNLLMVKDKNVSLESIENYLSSNCSLTINKAPAKLVISSYKTYYDSGKKYAVKVLNSKSNKTLSGVKVSLKVFTGKSYKTLTATTNSKGIASFALSKNAVGSHKIEINADGNVNSVKKNSTISISKAKTNIKLSKTSFKHKKSDNLKITLTNKNTKKAISSLKVKVKVCTGKKYKTYSLKTDKKGQIKINTKSLKKGSHKIIISSTSKYYAVKKTSTIKVK